MNRKPKTKMPIVIKRYMKYLVSENDNTVSTSEEYGNDIALLFRYIKIRYKHVPAETLYSDVSLDNINEDFVKKIRVDDIFEFIFYLKQNRKYSEMTIRRKIASIRSYYDYAYNVAKYINIDISASLKLPDRSEKLPSFLKNEQSIILLESVEGRNILRDQMIIALFLHSGIKLMELCNMDITALRKNELCIANINNIKRFVPLDEAIVNCLNYYLRWRLNKYKDVKLKESDKNALFLSEQKKRISPRAVQDIVLKAAKNAMLKKRISPQNLRHTFAILLYKKGFKIKDIQQILGHVNIESTQIYLNIPEVDLNLE